MTKREQIILAVLAVTLVIGGYTYFSDSTNQQGIVPDQSMKQVRALKADVDTALSTRKLSASQEYALKIISEPWNKDPFAISHKIVEEPIVRKDIAFDYSAYVMAGDTFVGVINGREYQVGDNLAEKGFTLVRIDTKTALIKGPGAGNMIVVPYKEYVRDK
jgi:hypothetical protein